MEAEGDNSMKHALVAAVVCSFLLVVLSGGELAQADTENFQVTFTFRKPNGNLLTNTWIQMSHSSDFPAVILLLTDSQGRDTPPAGETVSNVGGYTITLKDHTIHFRTEDGMYQGSAYVGASGGDISVTLSEVETSSLLAIIVILTVLIVCGTVVGLVFVLRKH